MSTPPQPGSASLTEETGLDPDDVDRPASVMPTEGDLEQLAHRPDQGQNEKYDPYQAFRYPSYVLLTLGWLVAVIGHAIQSTAVGWEIFERTGSALQLGYIAGIQAIPLILLALPAGHMADTFDRRKIIFCAQLSAAACSVWLAFLSYSPSWGVGWIYVAIVLNSTALVLGRPSRSSLMPMIVPPHVFANAVTWNSSMFQIATVAGPGIGGIIIAASMHLHGTLSLAYSLAAVGIGSFALVMPFIRLRQRIETNQPVDRSLSAGLKFVWKTRIILAAMGLDLFAVLLGGTVYLLPMFAKDVLGVGSIGFGWLRSAEATGALAMTIILAHLPPMKHAGRAILLAVACYGLMTVVFGLSTNFYLSFALLVIIGACDSISVVVRHTLIQVLTPDNMRGRVSAVNDVFIGASNELGGLESGAMAGLIGPVGAVVFGGIGTLISVTLIAARVPQIRHLGRLQKTDDP
ncbi:MAG: MFS transporter [Phycisphaerales bacterium]|nr:MFS transporter [Phycisphaerales bacterium]